MSLQAQIQQAMSARLVLPMRVLGGTVVVSLGSLRSAADARHFWASEYVPVPCPARARACVCVCVCVRVCMCSYVWVSEWVGELVSEWVGGVRV